MKRPLFFLAGLPLALWAAFTLPDVILSAKNPWDWRHALLPLFGTLALGWASAGIVLAARSPRLETFFGGLDRLYRLHKNIGIGAGVIVFTHWMLEWLPKNLAKAGFVVRPARGPRPPKGPEDVWIDLAKDVLADMVTNRLPAGAPVAVRVLGDQNDVCGTRLVVPLGPLDPPTVVSRVNAIDVVQEADTPLGQALRAVPDDLAGSTGTRIVLLITDSEDRKSVV